MLLSQVADAEHGPDDIARIERLGHRRWDVASTI
jgi:hypothetical protein